MTKEELDALSNEKELEGAKGEEIMQKMYDVHYKRYDEMPDWKVMQSLNTILFKRYRELSRIIRKNKPFELSEIDGGDVMTFEEFKEDCRCGCFIDSDGDGSYATETQESNIPIYPSDFDHEVYRDDFTHVVWYNK